MVKNSFKHDKQIKAVIVLITAVFVFFLSAASNAGHTRRLPLRQSDFVPEPVLLYPTSEVINIKGKPKLTFSWSPHVGDPVGREYYEFKIYKGYQTVESTLILSKRIKHTLSEFSVNARFFRNGEAYTWSLRQVYDGVHKSRPSTYSFKVSK